MRTYKQEATHWAERYQECLNSLDEKCQELADMRHQAEQFEVERDEAREELYMARAQLAAEIDAYNGQQSYCVRLEAERDRYKAALEVVHKLATEYDRPLGAIARTVLAALADQGEA